MLTERGRRALFIGFVTAVVSLALVQLFYYFCRTVDDLFITLRYAERLVAGHGLTYNDGERVEGFSSPLWVGLQAAMIGLGGDGVAATKLLSLASYGALLVGVYRLARVVLQTSRLGAWIAVGLVAASSYVAAWAMLGLETPLFLALLVHFVVATHQAARLGLNPLSPRQGITWLALAVALLTTRPEAPLYVCVLLAAAIIDQPGRRATVRRLAPWLLALAVITGALLVARKAYFGEWLPQTYFAKRGGALDVEKLAPQVSQGAPWPEVLVHAGALLLALHAALRLRTSAFVCCMLVNLVFMAKVEVDWMPSLRHALPLIVLGAPLWANLVTRARLTALPIGALLATYAVVSFAIDSRYSVFDHGTHGKRERWILAKDTRGWDTAWRAIQREWPAHIAALPPERLGQVMQVFLTIEAADLPLEDSWVIARDVGMLGYYTPVQVFETDGLFTPALTRSDAWRASETVDDALLDEAFDRTLVATELYGQWSTGLGRRADLRARFDITGGNERAPVRVRKKGLVAPDAATLRRRYDDVLAKSEAFFYVGTLYGESVGAAIEKRWQWMMVRLEPDVVARAPAGLCPQVPTLVDDDRILVHGCAIERVASGPALACYFEAKAPPSRDWQVFVHGLDRDGQRKLHRDHTPRRAATSWTRGEIIRDVTPIGWVADRDIRFGLWDPKAGMAKPATTDPGIIDGDGRLRGPTID